MSCLQLESEIPLPGLRSLEIAVDKLYKFLVEVGTKFETAKLV